MLGRRRRGSRVVGVRAESISGVLVVFGVKDKGGKVKSIEKWRECRGGGMCNESGFVCVCVWGGGGGGAITEIMERIHTHTHGRITQ